MKRTVPEKEPSDFSFRNPLQRGSHDCLDGVHTVLRLIEYDGLRTLENLVGYFHAVQAELLEDAFSDGGVQIVEGRQAVHEYGIGTGLPHDIGGDPIGKQILDAGFPYLIRFPHGDPNVCINDMGTGNRFGDVFLKFQHRTGFGGNPAAFIDQP